MTRQRRSGHPYWELPQSSGTWSRADPIWSPPEFPRGRLYTMRRCQKRGHALVVRLARARDTVAGAGDYGAFGAQPPCQDIAHNGEGFTGAMLGRLAVAAPAAGDDQLGEGRCHELVQRDLGRPWGVFPARGLQILTLL